MNGTCLFLIYVAATAIGASAPEAVADLLKAAGIRSGICVHITAEHDPTTASLGTSGRLLVQAFTPSDAVTDRIRHDAAARRVAGLVSAETAPRLDRLPYATHLVNLVLIDDLTEADTRGLSWPELFRIVVPRGTIMVGGVDAKTIQGIVRSNQLEASVSAIERVGRWMRVTTARPAWMGEWEHGLAHDSGGRGLADDRVPPDGPGVKWIQWVDAESRPPGGPAGRHNSVVALAASDRWFVTVANAETISWVRDGVYWRGIGKGGYALTVRDAFNGTLAWARPWRGLTARTHLAVASNTVFTVEQHSLVATDAPTGRELFRAALNREVQKKEDPFLCAGSVVILKMPGNKLVALEARTGAKRWSYAYKRYAKRIVADDRRVFLELEEWEAGDEFLALDIRTGLPAWRKSSEQLGLRKLEACLHSTRYGKVLVGDKKTVLRLSAADGSAGQSYRMPAFPGRAAGRALLVDNHLLVLADRAHIYDATTGKQLSPAAGVPHPSGGGVFLCGSTTPRTERSYLAVLDGKTAQARRRPTKHEFLGNHSAMRNCFVGAITANGTLYQPSQVCWCGGEMGKTTGLVALKHMERLPPRAAFLEPGSIERYSGRETESPAAPSRSDWPTFRGNASRSCGIAGTLPGKFRVKWRISPSHQGVPAPALAASWRGRHFYPRKITAPVVVGSVACVGLVEEHQLVAVDTDSGKELWRRTVNGPIDSPPTYCDGLWLLGCRDGYVYAFAMTGEPAWRRKLAPVDERICVYGQLESRFPVVGSILVRGPEAIAAAGLSANVGIMLCRFNPRTGKHSAYEQLPRGGYLNDVLQLSSSGAVFMNLRRVLPALAAEEARPAGRTPRLCAPYSGILETVRSTSPVAQLLGHLELNGMGADTWAWHNGTIVGYTRLGIYSKGRHQGRATVAGIPEQIASRHIKSPAVFAWNSTKFETDPDAAFLWEQPMREAWALAVCDNLVIAGGPEPKHIIPPPRKDLAAEAKRVQRKPTSRTPSRKLSASMFGRLAKESETQTKAMDKVYTDSRKRELEGTRLPTPPRPDGVPAARDPLWAWGEVWDLWNPVGQDPWHAKGVVKLLDKKTGKPLQSLALPATPIQDGIAITRGCVFVSAADGSLTCLAADR